LNKVPSAAKKDFELQINSNIEMLDYRPSVGLKKPLFVFKE
jgi:hypothetical protein